MIVYVAAGFVAGAWCGTLIGMLLWNEVVTRGVRDAYMDHVRRSQSKVQAWQRMALYAEGERVATSRAMYQALRDNDRHSRKATHLEAVR